MPYFRGMEIESEFVRRILQGHGQKLMRSFSNEINRLNVIDKKELLQSLNFNVIQGQGLSGTLQIFFALHGRFRDMGAGRQAKIEDVGKNGELYGYKRKKRKPAKWYSPTAYGSISTLIHNLLYNLDRETRQAIKQELEHKTI